MRSVFNVALAAIFSIFIMEYANSQDAKQDNKLDPVKYGFFKEKLGNMTSEGRLEDGKKEGNWVTYYPTGVVSKVEEYHYGLKNGLVLEIDSKGTIAGESFYKNDMLDGASKTFVRGMKYGYVKNYKENKLDGSTVIYYEDGTIQEEAWYKMGLRDSVTTWYNMHGKKVQSNFYRDGKFDGLSLTYHPNEKVKIEKNYVMDVLNGPYKEYDTAGVLIISGKYIDGNKKGEWLTYDESGKLISKEKIK